jgi:hypothetical protein
LVKSTGVSYEDAKIALESSGWDLLDAAVWLEKNGRTEARSNSFSTDPEQQEQAQRQQQQRNEAPRGSAETGHRVSGNLISSLISKIRSILVSNELVVCKQSGEIFLEIPVWLAVILLAVAFWPTLIVLVLVFILGFRFRFHGPDLGGETLNRVLNQAENSAAGFVDRIKNQRYYNNTRTSNPDRNEDVYDYQERDRRE